jgi:hypothetical protein
MAFLGNILNRENLTKLTEVTTNLEFLADAEERISEFYRLCAGVMPQEEALWNSLANSEVQHAETVRRMIELIGKQPELYKPGASFSIVAVRMFAIEMQHLVEQMNNGLISPGNLFKIALDIEESAVEVSYSRMAKTKERVFNSLVHKIDSESVEHRALISAKMTEVQDHPFDY